MVRSIDIGTRKCQMGYEPTSPNNPSCPLWWRVLLPAVRDKIVAPEARPGGLATGVQGGLKTR